MKTPTTGRKDEINYDTDSLTYRWWSRNNLYHTLISQDWLAEINDTFQNFISEHKNTATARLDELGAAIMMMHYQFNTPDDFDYAETQVNSVNGEESIDSITKLFLKAYLDYARDTFDFSVVKPKFEDIAELCVFYYGPSVLASRALLVNDNPDLFNYDWGDTLCLGGGGSSKTSEAIAKKKVNTQVETDYRLHPNLLKDKLIAHIVLKSEEKGVVEIYSMQGKLVETYSVIEGENRLDLSSIKTVSGIYFYRVWVNAELKNSDKLIILR